MKEIPLVDGMKDCRDCKQSLPATQEFFSLTRGRLNSYCKPCTSARAQANYRKNHEHGLAVRAAYRELHRGEWSEYFQRYRVENAERISKRDAIWRQGRAVLLRAKARARYRANRQEYIDRARRWAALNPEKASAHTLKKNHRRRGAEPDRLAREYVRILRGDPCCYCGNHVERIEIDHITPVSDGGDGAWDNLTPSCRSCNAAKGSRTLLSFLLERIAS